MNKLRVIFVETVMKPILLALMVASSLSFAACSGTPGDDPFVGSGTEDAADPVIVVGQGESDAGSEGGKPDSGVVLPPKDPDAGVTLDADLPVALDSGAAIDSGAPTVPLPTIDDAGADSAVPVCTEPGYTYCSIPNESGYVGCADLQNDPGDCGTCGHGCTTGYSTCQNGVCGK